MISIQERPKSLRLALVISSLSRGGAEGVLVRLANGLAARGHAITVVTLSGAQPQLTLNPTVAWIPMDATAQSEGIGQAIAHNISRVRLLRRIILRLNPHAVLSFMDTTNVLTLLAARGQPVLVSERVNPELHDTGCFWRILRTLTYPMASALVVQTHLASQRLPRRLAGKARVIPNPVAKPRALARPTAVSGGVLVAMGRLEAQKGFDILLRAFAALPDRTGWRLVIHGEGSMRHSLEALRDALNLGDCVRLPGRTNDPSAALAEGDLFVLSSRFEGFPNALAEAMACGLPVVAFDCPYGPGELVRNERDGLLVPPGDVQALTHALHKLMTSPHLRIQMSQHARDVTERFSEQTVLDMWEKTIRFALNDTPRRGLPPCAA